MKTPPPPPPQQEKGASIGSRLKPTAPLGVRSKADRPLIFLMLGMFMAGVVLMAWGGYEIKGSRESGSWPSTQGTITSSGMSKRTTRDSNHRTRISYYPKVAYRYQIQGRPYTGSRIEFGGERGGDQKWAQKIVNKYPAGKKVDVYYNPQDLQYAILEAGFTWSSLLIFLSGILFFAIGVLCLKIYMRSRRKAKNL